jgi:hypothetical protein
MRQEEEEEEEGNSDIPQKYEVIEGLEMKLDAQNCTEDARLEDAAVIQEAKRRRILFCLSTAQISNKLTASNSGSKIALAKKDQ